MKIPKYRIIEKHCTWDGESYSRFYPQFQRFWIWWNIYDGLFQTSLDRAKKLIANHRKKYITGLIPDNVYYAQSEDHIMTTIQEMENMLEGAKKETPLLPKDMTYLEARRINALNQ